MLKICSQRTYLLKLLRDQGMPRTHLNTVFRAIILAKITYALPAWRGFLTVEQIGRIIPFLSEHLNMVCSPSCSHFWIWLMMLTKHCLTLCLKKQHCLQVILPEIKTSSIHLRQKGHMFDLPRCTLENHKDLFCHGVCLNSFNCF